MIVLLLALCFFVTGCSTGLTLILEQVTGDTYEEYTKQHIFEVCDMKNTTSTETGNITSVPGDNAEYMPVAGWIWGTAIFIIAEVHGVILRITLLIKRMERIFT